MKTQLIIVVAGIIFLTWCGVSLGRWANHQVAEAEARQAAISEVLRK